MTTTDDANGRQMEEATMRDWFAAHALTGMLSSDLAIDYQWAAGEAYKVADAMMEARK